MESTAHFFLHFNFYNSPKISSSRLHQDLSLVNLLFDGGPQFDDSQNALILNHLLNIS